MGVFALVEQMLTDRNAMIPAKAASGNAYSNKRNYKINFFAALSACVAVFAGNAHYIVYGIIKPLFNVSGEPSGYWFPDATRYIGYNPEVNARPSKNLTPGEDYGTYPLARTYMFGLNLTL